MDCNNKITIWTYNLTDFTVEKVEVDYVVGNKKAVSKRQPKMNGCEVCEKEGKCIRNCPWNTKVFVKFELLEEYAKQRVIDYLKNEIQVREDRMKKLKDALLKLEA